MNRKPKTTERNDLSEENSEMEEDKIRYKGLFNWPTHDHTNLPVWMQDNSYIISSYRPPLSSYLACFLSIFRLHNETMNIWTHLLGCILFIVLAIRFWTQPSTSLEAKCVFAPFFLGAILCLGFSTSFHIVTCHSQAIDIIFNRLDYCGISLLITGSFVPWLYYGFYCDFWSKVIYISVITVMGVSVIIVSLADKFNKPKYRSLRATIFTVFGLSGVVPGLHVIYNEGWTIFFTHGWSLLCTACLYILGAVIYAARVPERLYPGKCDLWFHSHQFFHVLVVAATVVDYYGLQGIAVYAETVKINYC